MNKYYKKFALNLAEESGKIIKSNFQFGMEKDDKEDGSPVTKTDLEINQLVVDSIREEFPSHGIISEELDDIRGEGEYFWVCDPVDGTVPFSHGFPMSSFSLALVKNGEPILGVANNPFGGNVFFAEKGKGAFLNGSAMRVSKRDSFVCSTVCIEDWKQALRRTYPLFDSLEDLNCNAMQIKSVVYAGCLVALGEIVAVVFPGPGSWDIAALKVIVEEAGGKVTDLDGQEQRYDQAINGGIVSNGILHDQLVELVGTVVKK
jgi:fructose-1,6-bisphosphatase/inositol monophosphatase family enzyme